MLTYEDEQESATQVGRSFDLIDDVLVDVVDSDGRILFMNLEQAATLGLERKQTHGLDVSAIYTDDTVEAIEALFRRDVPEGFQTTLEFSLIGRGGRIVRTLARCRGVVMNGQLVYRFAKVLLAGYSEELDTLKANEAILRNIVNQASEGHWCIEFLEPVDLDANKEAVIDQIFENASIWRVTNKAMDRLYDLPSGESIAMRDVRLYWPRSPENEEFVSQVYDANFHIDNALALDRRHDGTEIRVENDVRADIEDGMLYRIWGNCRDVTAPQDAEASSNFHTAQIASILDSLPSPVLAIEAKNDMRVYNTAFANRFSDAEEVSGKIQAALKSVSFKKARIIERKLKLEGAPNETTDCAVTEHIGADGAQWQFVTIKTAPDR